MNPKGTLSSKAAGKQAQNDPITADPQATTERQAESSSDDLERMRPAAPRRGKSKVVEESDSGSEERPVEVPKSSTTRRSRNDTDDVPLAKKTRRRVPEKMQSLSSSDSQSPRASSRAFSLPKHRTPRPLPQAGTFSQHMTG